MFINVETTPPISPFERMFTELCYAMANDDEQCLRNTIDYLRLQYMNALVDSNSTAITWLDLLGIANKHLWGVMYEA